MWKRSLAFLLLWTGISYAQVGYFVRTDCDSITSPVNDSTACLQTTTVGGRTAGHVYIRRTGAWVDIDTTGGAVAFSAITGATNTTAAMVVGTGASLAATGSGTIAATTAAALAADGANCAAGQGAGGVSAAGVAQDCTVYIQGTVAVDQIAVGSAANTIAGYAALKWTNSTTIFSILGSQTIAKTLTDLSADFQAFKSELLLQPVADSATAQIGVSGAAWANSGANIRSLGNLNGGYFFARQDGTGGVTGLVGTQGDSYHNGSGTVGSAVGVLGKTENDAGGTITAGYGIGSYIRNLGVGTITNAYGLFVEVPVNSGGGTIGTNYGLYIRDQLVTGGTSDYAIWYNGVGTGEGVWRLKSDGVVAYYNPAFAAYTPDAVNFERVVTQWTSDVAEIGTEAGGTGTQRRLRLLGANVEVPSLTASRPVISDASKNLASGTYSGNTTTIATTSGALTSGNCVKIDASGNLVDHGSACGGSGSPGGVDTQVQFNDGGSFGGDAGLVFNKTSNVLTAGEIIDSGLTASRLVASDASKQLVSTITSANTAASVSDETGTGALVFGTDPALTAPAITGTPNAAGELGYNSTNGATTQYSGLTATVAPFPRVLSAAYNNDQKTNSVATDQDFTSIYTIPASVLIAGKILMVSLLFQNVTDAAAAGINIYLKLGATKVYTHATAQNSGNNATRSWKIDLMVLGTAGAGAAVAVVTIPDGVGNNTGSTNNTTQPVNLATNGTLAVTPGIAFNSTAGSESMTLLGSVIMEMN